MHTGMFFMRSKVLLAAVKLQLFTVLEEHGPMTANDLGNRLGLHPRAWYDFFDALVAMGFLNRDGDGPEGVYRNTIETAQFLVRDTPEYVGGMLEMCNDRLFRFWGDLDDALRTGQPQNEIRHSQKPVFEELYSDLPRLEQFMSAMAGISIGQFRTFANMFDFSKYNTLCDVGGATGLMSKCVAERHPHMHCISFDLPAVEPIAKRHIEEAGLSDRIETASGDFFNDPLPKADIISMGKILHDWNLEKKMHLIQAAYDALPEGGAFVAIEHLIDDARRENVSGLMISLTMLIEFGDAFDFTGADFKQWCTQVGFKHFEIIPLDPQSSAAVAYK